MTYSNLSKIKPKLRTQGNVTGNFGKTKVKAGSNLNQIGLTTKQSVTVTTPNDYINKMYRVLDTSTNQRLRDFAYSEIKKYLIQTNQWNT
tara:strand:+ start:1204 stop:1473 length:270 start_codon:yes stop_codon:yes gene_type:complete